MATAAAEVAEGFFGRPLADVDGPHNDAWGMFDHQSREHGSYSDQDLRHLPSQYQQQNTQPDLWASDRDDFLTVDAIQHARAFYSQQPDENPDETDDVPWVNIANGFNVDHFDDNDSVTRDPFVRDEDASEYNAGGVARDYANASRLDGYDVDGNNFDGNYRGRYQPRDFFPGSGNTSDDGDAFGRTVPDTMQWNEVVDSGSETFGSNSNHRTVSNVIW
ncbi:hypothetical protein SPBR_02043 [Sporothrix brasiliensis 5110]|uniref:Uncharacterized protein n=1 Tax=Sporothrix brasiliensis 5110 TaxID=1398154 RepID=A0A0C2IQL0_9PEZI|nr:uncharacterized protein SPBR_02043 [Sporothrix brasiliensis 5110]KIH91326.1 hypothetical protein SPBR_02043 [Sporothrix brasiliensis 5110]